jgi:hypothetical protein
MSELQQAYENSRATYRYARVQVPAGMFAVVTEVGATCPITDAQLPGVDQYLTRLCGTRRVAEYYARFHTELISEDAEYGVRVIPAAPLPAVVPAQPRLDDDTIPF